MMRGMFIVDRRAGRLVEARVFSLTNLNDVRAYSDAFAPVIHPSDGVRVANPVLCADHRPVPIYPPAVADSLVTLFTSLNAKWERVAIIVSPSNATIRMQLHRIVRESANPSRRVFLDAIEASAFLGEILSPLEQARLDDFLSAPLEAPPSSTRR
jgi:hypothetical protein